MGLTAPHGVHNYIGENLSDAAATAQVGSLFGMPLREGLFYYNTATKEFRYWNGTAWTPFGSGGAPGAAVDYVDAYDLNGGTPISTTWTDVPLSALGGITGAFAHTPPSPEIRIEEDDLYVVAARVTAENPNGWSTAYVAGQLVHNSGGGFNPVAGGVFALFTRESGVAQSTGSVLRFLSLSAGDRLKIQVQASSGSNNTPALVAHGSGLVIYKLKGPKGDQGAPGVPGAGSTVNVMNGGAPVTGTPFGTLNFASGFNVVPGAGGQVDITSTGGLFGSGYHYAAEEAEASSTSNQWVTRVTLPLLGLPAGTYRIEYSCELNHGGAGYTSGRVRLDGGEIGEVRLDWDNQSTNIFKPFSGFAHIPLGGNHTVTLDYRRSAGWNTARIRRARITVWRVA